MLYLSHFGLREVPFGITPDTSFFYACRSMQESLNTLLVAVANGEGFIKITGEVGTGKTLLCRKFMASLDENYVTAYLPNPSVEPGTLLLALAEELGVRVESTINQHHLMKRINLALLDFARNKKRVLVCLDEAQAMPLETLEMLRLVSNLETEKRKLLQVVMFGQPELDQKLSEQAIRQLRQRITFEHRLSHLTWREVEHYLAHRMKVAGYHSERVFTRAAVRTIYRASRGVPRLINILANKALMLAYGKGTDRVNWAIARAAVGDTPASYRPAPAWMWTVLLCVAGSSLGWMLLR